jgi:L-ribulose-5-phosphate 3-epimerase
MKLGYNTNGFAHHRLEDALGILADFGYQSVALTLDHHHLDPFAADYLKQADCVRKLLQRLKLDCVIETGARFLLDPQHKHQPTLLSRAAPERTRRLSFLKRSCEIAAALGSAVVSLWSGTPTSAEPDMVLLERLAGGLRELLDFASARQVKLALEPEPGMFIATLDHFARLHSRMGAHAPGLTVDFGHLFCQHEEPITDRLKEWRGCIWNIHIEDMRRGIHEHLFFGEGEMDFPPLAQALRAIDYDGGVHVELSRHSHNAVQVAAQSRAFLLAAGFGP